MTKTSVALATAVIALCAGCAQPNNQCVGTQRFDQSLRMCVGQCGTPEAPAHPRCYDQDSGTFIATPGFDAGADDASTDAIAPTMDASDASIANDGGGLDAPRPVFPMSLVVLAGQQPTFKWALAAGTDGASVELCRDRAMTADCQRWTATGSESRAPSPLARGMWFWRLTGRSGNREGSAKSVTWSFWSSGRPSARDASYAQVPDINGDGLADIVFVDNDTREFPSGDAGVPDGGAWVAPRLAVFYGQRGGVAAMPTVIEPTGAWPPFGGGFVADIDGDGFGDVVNPAMPPAESFTLEQLRIVVLRGSATGLSTTPQWINAPDVQFSGFGFLQFPIGDTDGDGRIEIALCSPGDLRENATRIRGRCHIFSGTDTGLSTIPRATLFAPAFTTYPTFATILSPPPSSQGDINGDGRADMIVTSAEFVVLGETPVEGRSFVYLSRSGGLPADPTQTIVAPSRSESWGFDTSVLGDPDGDGALDILVSSIGNTSTLYRFSVTATNVALPAASSRTSTASEQLLTWRAIGDVTGDGLSDVAIAWLEPGGAQPTQVSAIARGLPTGVDTELVRFAPATMPRTSWLPVPLVAVGDVDGDGIFDVLDWRDHRVCFGNATAIPNRCVSVLAPTNTTRTLLRPMF